MKTSSKKAIRFALSLGGVSQKDHFGSDAFYANKKMFATVWHDSKEVNLRLSPEDQRHFLEHHCDAFSEINNSWGRQGWTKVHLDNVEDAVFQHALVCAWGRLATTKGPKNEKK
jgi:hypothetical protein